MKCLSLWQPWATLLAHGRKRVETRGWSTSHRGPLLIHAAKKWTREIEEIALAEPFARVLREIGVLSYGSFGAAQWSLPLGAIVGRVDVADVFDAEDVWAEPNHTDAPVRERRFGMLTLTTGMDEHAFGDYSPGRFAWLCTNPVAFATPLPFRGAQGLFDVPEDLLLGAA